jgi:hypothetical protein
LAGRTKAIAALDELGADAGEAQDFAYFLTTLATEVRRPVYFVHVNHDFYQGSFAWVREQSANLGSNLHWLPRPGVVKLTDIACQVGHDGWGDGRIGDYWNSDMLLNDWGLIAKFDRFEEYKGDRLWKLMALGDEAAAHIQAVLPEALKQYRHAATISNTNGEASNASVLGWMRMVTTSAFHPRARMFSD